MNEAINAMIEQLQQAAEIQVRTEYEKTIETLRGRVATLEREMKSLQLSHDEWHDAYRSLCKAWDVMESAVRSALDGR